jgi:hypothetical protein
MHTTGAKAKEIEQDLGCGRTAPAIFRAESVDEGDYEAVISLLKTYGYRHDPADPSALLGTNIFALEVSIGARTPEP